ncbi:MAG: M67 family peptidase [Caldilineae bacterium]|nr:MAG: M67 family peptidase [Caldilineae bacterium]
METGLDRLPAVRFTSGLQLELVPLPLTMSATLHLPRHIFDEIVAHAREGKPQEVCGLLRGRGGWVTEIRRARNVAANPVMDYEVDPVALLVQFDWEEAGDEMIAIYHSHPQDPAYPSASDAFNAHYPDAVYLICSLLDETRPVLKGYFLRPAEGQVDLQRLDAELSFYETRPSRWAAYVPAEEPLPSCLAGVDRTAGQALYVVYEQVSGHAPDVRVVTVEPVAVRVEEPPDH